MRHAASIAAATLTVAGTLVSIGIWVGTIGNRVSTNETNVQHLVGRIDAMQLTMSSSAQRAARSAEEAPFYLRLSLDNRQRFVDAATESETADEYRSSLARLFPDQDPADLEMAVSGWQSAGLMIESPDRFREFLRESERDRHRQD